MRALLLLLLGLGIGGGGAWWLLRPSSEPDPTLDPVGPLRPPARAPTPEVPPLEIPRVGVQSPQDRGMVARPGAEAWDLHILDIPGGPEDSVTGAALLNAIGERLYVRARSQADLDAFRAQVFRGVTPGVGVPLGAVKLAIERAGWRVAVSDPRFVFRPATPEEQARDRAASEPDGR